MTRARCATRLATRPDAVLRTSAHTLLRPTPHTQHTQHMAPDEQLLREKALEVITAVINEDKLQ